MTKSESELAVVGKSFLPQESEESVSHSLCTVQESNFAGAAKYQTVFPWSYSNNCRASTNKKVTGYRCVEHPPPIVNFQLPRTKQLRSNVINMKARGMALVHLPIFSIPIEIATRHDVTIPCKHIYRHNLPTS